MSEYRIGHGYDVHKLAGGRPLILGGVIIEHEYGLLGHSDADVLLHAIMDSLLGAAALGDIGQHFPDTDEKFKDISSLYLLECVCDLLHENGYTVNNIDSTIVAQSPRLSPFIDEMRSIIAKTLCVDRSCVSVKATTTEWLGFEGRGEGISAQSVCLLNKLW